METQRPNRLVLIAFIVSTILGGNNAIAVRFSNAELPPFFGAAVRFAAASILLFLVALAMRLKLPTGRALIGVLIFGVLNFGLTYALLYWSLQSVGAGLVQVLLALVPLLTFAVAIVHRQQAFEWRILIGGLVAVGGIALVFINQLNASAPLIPMLVVFLAAACVAESVVLVKSFPKNHPITTSAVAMLAGTVFLAVLSILWRETPTLPTLPATWLALAYMIVAGSVISFGLIVYVLKHWTATAASYQLVLTPIVTVLFASWLRNETVTGVFILGGVLVLVGVYIGAIASPNQLKRFLSRKPAAPEEKTTKPA